MEFWNKNNPKNPQNDAYDTPAASAQRAIEAKMSNLNSNNGINSYKYNHMDPDVLRSEVAAGIHDGDLMGESFGKYAKGGIIRGPGTGTSDSIHTKVPVGAAIIPAHVVETVGKEALDNLEVDAALSDGEYQLSPETVKRLGTPLVERLIGSGKPKGIRKYANGVAQVGLTPDQDVQPTSIREEAPLLATNPMRSPEYQVANSTGAKDPLTGLNPNSMRSPDEQRGIAKMPEAKLPVPEFLPKAPGTSASDFGKTLIGEKGMDAVGGTIAAAADNAVNTGGSIADTAKNAADFVKADAGRTVDAIKEDYANSGYGVAGAVGGVLGRGFKQLADAGKGVARTFIGDKGMAAAGLGADDTGTPTTADKSQAGVPNKNALWSDLTPEQQEAQKKAGEASVQKQLADPEYAPRGIALLNSPDRIAGLSDVTTGADGIRRVNLNPDRYAEDQKIRTDLESRLTPEQRTDPSGALQRRMDLADRNASQRLAAESENAPFNDYLNKTKQEGGARLQLAKDAWKAEREASIINPHYDAKFGPNGEVASIRNDPNWRPSPNPDSAAPRGFYADSMAKKNDPSGDIDRRKLELGERVQDFKERTEDDKLVKFKEDGQDVYLPKSEIPAAVKREARRVKFDNDPANKTSLFGMSKDELAAKRNAYLAGEEEVPKGASSSVKSAPEAALQRLKSDRSLATDFKQKYGYLPEGY